jgi:hypothetical protein
MAQKKSPLGTLLGLVTEIPPAAYVLITGHAPTWIRIWFGVWLGLWLLFTVIVATDATTNR